MNSWFNGMSLASEVFWTVAIGCVTVIAVMIIIITWLWVPIGIAVLLLVVGATIRFIVEDFGSGTDDHY